MPIATLADRIADWIAAAAREAKLKGAVVGLSGGVDSAVTVSLCKRGLGDHVLGVMMPCRSRRQDEHDAELGITCEQLDRTLEAIESRQATGLAPETVARARQMVAASAHKRARAGICEVRDPCACVTKRT